MSKRYDRKEEQIIAEIGCQYIRVDVDYGAGGHFGFYVDEPTEELIDELIHWNELWENNLENKQFDAESFNAKGLELAIRLKKELPHVKIYLVTIGNPEERFEIIADGDVLMPVNVKECYPGKEGYHGIQEEVKILVGPALDGIECKFDETLTIISSELRKELNDWKERWNVGIDLNDFDQDESAAEGLELAKKVKLEIPETLVTFFNDIAWKRNYSIENGFSEGELKPYKFEITITDGKCIAVPLETTTAIRSNSR